MTADLSIVGLLLEGRGVVRGHQKILFGGHEGEVTSGTFSPTLGRAIGMGRVPAAASTVRAALRLRQPVEDAGQRWGTE